MSSGPYEQWKATTTYFIGNTVQNITSVVYQCILDPCLNIPPPNATYWSVVAPPPPTPSGAISTTFVSSVVATPLTTSPTTYLAATLTQTGLGTSSVSAIFTFTNGLTNTPTNRAKCRIYVAGVAVGIEMTLSSINIAYTEQTSQMSVEWAGMLSVSAPSSTLVQLKVFADGVGLSTLNGTMTIITG